MTEYTKDELGLPSIKIDKGVPRRERYPRNAFHFIAKQMSIGDSVLCPDYRVLNGLQIAMNKLGFSTETRKEGSGRRIWRIK